MQNGMKTPLVPNPSSYTEAPPPSLTGPVIGIIGSGDFSRSLSIRLVSCGFRVVVGSRDPDRVDEGLFPDGVELMSQREALQAADSLVFVAVFPEYYHTLLDLKEALDGKVLVDVSNAERLGAEEGSNAERLAEMFPKSSVVKGFNVVSAWALQVGAHDGGRQVLICGDCSSSKASVLQLATRLGFTPVDMGGLSVSRNIEEAPLILFPSWGRAVLTTFLLFLFFYFYNFIKRILLPYLDKGENNFYQLPLVTVNESLPSVALVTLALVYLPGVLAAVLQLIRGTKYRRFPFWLDCWLCCRKQLGLLSFLCAVLHAIYSMCLSLRRGSGVTLTDQVYPQVKDEFGNTLAAHQAWRSDLYLSSGILGFGVLTLLAITSLPSVGNALNWREFTFVQSGLGYAALTLSVTHTLFFGWDFAFYPSSYQYYLPPVFVLSLILPCTVLVSRALLALPCLASRLTKIRRGWESQRQRAKRSRGLESAEMDPPQIFGDA